MAGLAIDRNLWSINLGAVDHRSQFCKSGLRL